MDKTDRSPARCCPYPDCSAQHGSSCADGGIFHVADHVFLCRECGRLSYECITPTCYELNRPYSYYCRKCGKCQFLRSSGQTTQTAASRWQRVQQFDHAWRFRTANEKRGAQENTARHKAILTDPATVAILDGDSAFIAPASRGTQQENQNRVLLECRFLDGLLAIHQGGYYLRLLHPFADVVNRGPTRPALWAQSEAQLLHSAGQRAPQEDYEPEKFRPYPPHMTQDRRFVVFATPYFCAGMDLWTLPGWCAVQQPACEVLFAFDENSEVRLAAAPVPLTVQRWPHRQIDDVDLQKALVPNQIGLLLRHNSGSYWWCNLKLEQFFGDGASAARKELADCIKRATARICSRGADATPSGEVRERSLPFCVPVPLEGEAVQVNFFREECLIFATAAGHWLWARDDACDGRVIGSSDAPRESKHQIAAIDFGNVDGADTTEFLTEEGLDGEHRGLWSLRDESSKMIELDNQIAHRKNFSWQKQCVFSTSSTSSNKFEIAYTVDKCARTRGVAMNQRRQTENSRPVDALNSCRGLLSWSAPDSKQNELLFVSGIDGAIHKRINTRRDTIRLQNMQIGEVNDVYGLQFRDPLLVLVRDDPSGQDLFEVQLRTLRYSSDVAVVDRLDLQADPVTWSSFMFTCEAEQTHILLKRREFLINSEGSDGIVYERPALGHPVGTKLSGH